MGETHRDVEFPLVNEEEEGLTVVLLALVGLGSSLQFLGACQRPG